MDSKKTLTDTLIEKGFQVSLEAGRVVIAPLDKLTDKQVRFLKKKRHQLIAEAIDRLDPKAPGSCKQAVDVIRRGYAIQFHSGKTGGRFWLVATRKAKEKFLAKHRDEELPVYALSELKALSNSGLEAEDLSTVSELVAVFGASVVGKPAASAKPTDPSNVFQDPIEAVKCWLDRIGEQDPEIREEILKNAADKPEALQCYLRCAAEHGILVMEGKSKGEPETEAEPSTPTSTTASTRQKKKASPLLRPA